MILLGSPRSGGWLVIVLSLLGLMALFAVPLMGCTPADHHQHEQALAQISKELLVVQHTLVGGAVADAEKLAALAQHTATLINSPAHTQQTELANLTPMWAQCCGPAPLHWAPWSTLSSTIWCSRISFPYFARPEGFLPKSQAFQR